MDFSKIFSGNIPDFATILLGLLIGMAIASLLTVYNRAFMGRLVRRLLKKEAFSEETALTLSRLGYPRNPLIRLSLARPTSALRKAVNCTVDKKHLSAEDFKNAGFYIPEEKKEYAESRFTGKNNTVIIAVIGIIILAVAFLLVIKFFPDLTKKYTDIFKE